MTVTKQKICQLSHDLSLCIVILDLFINFIVNLIYIYYYVCVGVAQANEPLMIAVGVNLSRYPKPCYVRYLGSVLLA